jgi:membrane associated rhomboid family serine protease
VRRQVYPLVTRLLVAANVLVFLWGLWLASPDSFGVFIGAMFQINARVIRVLEQIGGARAPALVSGEWWRLLTNWWVHIGLLHLLVNMYALNGLGRTVEQMYGRGRYLVLYALAGFCGSCVGMMPAAMAKPPYPILAGASGAVCGVLGAEAVWVLLNGRYLPRMLKRRWHMNLLTNFFLLAFISVFPGVSGMGHLGGAVGGAVAGLLLNWQRFGKTPLRWLAVPALACLPWAGLALLDHARATQPGWHDIERQEFEKKHLKEIGATLRGAYRLCDEELRPILRHDPADRDQAELPRAQEQLAQQQAKLAELEALLRRLGPYYDEGVEGARVGALSYATALRRWVEAIQRVLAAGDKVTPEEREQVKAREKEAEARKADWRKWLQ